MEPFFHVTASREAALRALVGGVDEVAIVTASDVLRAHASGSGLVSLMPLDVILADELVVATTDALRVARGPALAAFVAASHRGYLEAARDPKGALELLVRAEHELDRAATERALAEVAVDWREPPLQGDARREERWRALHTAMVQRAQLRPDVDPRAAFVDDFLPKPPTPTPHPTATVTHTPTLTPRPLPATATPAAPVAASPIPAAATSPTPASPVPPPSAGAQSTPAGQPVPLPPPAAQPASPPTAKPQPPVGALAPQQQPTPMPPR